MEAMGHERITIEKLLRSALWNSVKKLPAIAHSSCWWQWAVVLSLPFLLITLILVLVLTPILVGVRLAITNADRVVFVLASALLSFYGVPHKVFYGYIAVLAVTGFLQFLRCKSPIRDLCLRVLSNVSCGTSDMLLRKCTTLHFSNPFSRRRIVSTVIYMPIGSRLPDYSRIEVFDFPVSKQLYFDKIIGSCKIVIETVDNIITDSENMTTSSTIRVLDVDAPWGRNRYSINMNDDNLGRLISYLDRIFETNCWELICTRWSDGVEALSLLETINHFNSGLPLVKLESEFQYHYDIH